MILLQQDPAPDGKKVKLRGNMIQIMRNSCIMQVAWKFGSNYKITSKLHKLLGPQYNSSCGGLSRLPTSSALSLDSITVYVPGFSSDRCHQNADTDTMPPGLGSLLLFTICHKMTSKWKEGENIIGLNFFMGTEEKEQTGG